MKDINLKDFYEYSVIENYDKYIKLCYSENYLVLKYLFKSIAADKALREFEQNNGSSSFPKMLKTKIYDILHKSAGESRFVYFMNLIGLINDKVFDINRAYIEEAGEFFENFKKYYNSNKTFEECFCGLEVLDQNFLQDISKYEKNLMTQKEVSKFSGLYNDYFVFHEETKLLFNFMSLCDIINSLNNDFDEVGYKTINFEVPQKDVALISREEINKLRKIVMELYLVQDKEIKNQEHIVKNAKMFATKNSNDQKMQDELDNEINKLNDIYNKSQYIVNFEKIINIFEERLDFANFDYNINTKIKCSNKIRWNVGNLGARKLKKPINRVYYHRAEATMLEFNSRELGSCDDLVLELIERAGGKYNLNFLKISSQLKMFGYCNKGSQME